MDNRSLNFWAIRSKGYNQLEWANNQSLLEAIRRHGDFKEYHVILDVGCGTGIVAKHLAQDVRIVVGIDSSAEMLASLNGDKPDNVKLFRGDIREKRFSEGLFDGIVARYAFHHFTGFAQEAMDNCYRMASDGAKCIVCEGTPPDKESNYWYTDMFKLKEDRITVYESDIAIWMLKSGFKKIETHVYTLKNMSIKNWLNSSGLPQDTKDKIFNIHTDAPDSIKRAYNMVVKNDDCLIDMRNVVVVGIK